MVKKILFVYYLIFSLMLATFVKAESVSLVSSGDTWKYFKGTASPSLTQTYWRTLQYTDSSWPEGNAPLYYGGNITAGTLLSDMKGSYSSVYMRKTISLPVGTYENLKLDALNDDGFILWINGTEVLRNNVPDGILNYNGLAESLVTVATWQSFDLSEYSNVLNPGSENIIAIHGFNISLDNSGDFAMDIVLTADYSNDTEPPLVSNIQPTTGSVIANPPRITVTFNEPVSHVTTNSLLCNGVAAETVLATSTRQYIFEFPRQSQDGLITITWNADTDISDLSENTNIFVPPTESLTYTVDSTMVQATVIINEIMADNDSILASRYSGYSDWIELYNQDAVSVDISGWYLTDSKKDLTQWQFPLGTIIEAGGYLIVFCDSATIPTIYGKYHTNFNLSKDGEYLALVYSDGQTIIQEFDPYPSQLSDISYGQGLYYPTPTPGAANESGYLEPVGDIQFSETRGYKSAAFQLTLSTETEGASIYYTTDGTVPSISSTLYTAPLQISTITTIRAVAIKNGHLDSPVNTRTWLFMEEVLSQSTSTPSGWPNSYSVNNHKLEYGMNSSIVNSSKYTEGIRRGLTNIATISMVTDLKNLFDASTGIYVNPLGDGVEWERPASLELIDPSGGDEFQIEAGIRLRGAASRTSSNPKHSFRFFFRSKYGGSLKFPLFGDEGVSEFDKVDLRTSQNYSWAYEQTPYDTFIRETFARDSQRDVGMPYTRSRYYHLYINGQYWGIYQTQERSETSYAESYLGGDKDDWDCIKTEPSTRATVVSEGTSTAITALHSIAINEGFAGVYATNYWRIKGMNPDGTVNPDLPQYLDEDNLLEYMLNVYVTCDTDSPISVWGGFANNLFALYDRVDPSGFKWFRHDAEHAMGGRRFLGYGENFNLVEQGWNNYDTFVKFNPMRLHQKLMEHPDYRMKFIDLYQKRVLNEGGAFTYDEMVNRWNKRQAELDDAIIVESARWGHGYTREDWLTECDYVLNTFFVVYPTNLDADFREKDWLSDLEAPVLEAPAGLLPTEEDPVTVLASNQVYYTTDGNDPRLPGGAINPSASVITGGDLAKEILIPKNAEWLYYSEGSSPPRISATSWYISLYNDSAWNTGSGVLGYGGKETTTISQYVSETETPITTSYFRYHFDIPDNITITSVNIAIACDDGAVVWLNGGELLRQNMPSASQYSTYASSEVEGEDEMEYTTYLVNVDSLKTSGNVLAVEVHQASAESKDLYFDLEMSTNDSFQKDEFQADLPIIGSASIKARVYNGSEWSALAELDCTIPASYTDLKVTEMMYAAEVPDWAAESGWDRDDFAWIELQNTGSGVLDMEGIQFVQGIDYTFPSMNLGAGERVVLAKNLEAFSSMYETNGICLLSGYSGNLARNGETITIQDPTGEKILSYIYSNTWYPGTDQGGYSLVVVDTQAEEVLWSTAANWRASLVTGGNPGAEKLNTQPLISGCVFDEENGSLSFSIEGVTSFKVEASNDLQSWYEFENWKLIDGKVVVGKDVFQEQSLFFRIKI